MKTPILLLLTLTTLSCTHPQKPDPLNLTYGTTPFTPTPSFQDNFNSDWNQNHPDWRVATWSQNNTQMSPDRCKTDEHGNLIQTVLPGQPAKGGSLQTAKEYPHGRWIARVKPSSTPGALNSIFTKDWDNLTTPDNDHDGTGFEVDIEFLTYTFAKNKGQVHIAIHANGKPNLYKADLDLDFNPSDDFHVWGFDILPNSVTWHVDGRTLHTWQSPDPIPANYEFFFNSWTMHNWIKGPPTAEAHYAIDWVRFYPLKK